MGLGETVEFAEEKQQQEAAHIVSFAYSESIWRNRQLQRAIWIKELGMVSPMSAIDNLSLIHI